MKPVNHCFGYRRADVTVLIRSRITLGAAKLGLAVLLIGGLGGSESASPNTNFEKIAAAQASLSFLASASGHVCHPEGCESKDFDIAGFGLSSDGTDDNKLILQFSATDKSNVQGFYLDTLQVTSSLFSPDTVTISGWSFHATSDQASRVADALMAVKSFAGIYWRYRRIVGELDFAIIARSYRSLPTKPILSEDVHRYQVQATDAVQNKEFDAAAVLYSRALKIAPWWPEGEFNLGLILGELKQFHYAIVYMKRYLALVPDASNARQVQDKIYVWERLDKTAAFDPVADSQWLDTMYSSSACKLCVIAPEIPSIVAFAHHLPDAKGALIVFVAKGSVGEAVGLLPEDIVVSVAGSPVVRPADVKSALAGVQAGTVVPVEIVRGDQRMTVNVKF